MKIFSILVVAVALLFIGNAYFSKDTTEDIISQNGIHWHPTLRIFVHGEEVPIPGNVGLVGIHNPIHTHNDLPLIHMEFEGKVTDTDTELGNFFRIWNVPFDGTHILTYENGDTGMVHMYVNGEENFEYGAYRMKDGDDIEIRYE